MKFELRSQVLIAALLCPILVNAQELLDIDRSCLLFQEGSTEDVYVFPPDQRTSERFRRIAEFVGMEGDIELLAANVTSVVAVVQDDRRLVLYNTDFVYPSETPDGHDLKVLAMLAHSVAHHVLGHSLISDGAWIADELEADRYSGGLLAQLSDDPNQAFGQLQRSMVMYNTGTGPEPGLRQQAIIEGWLEADEAIAATAGPGYGMPENGGDGSAIPRFPWPPPQASARVRIPLELNTSDGTLADVARVLETAFYAAGYGDFSYLAIPEGFAMVSQLEQIEPDGTPLPLPDRWSTRVRPIREFTLENYVRALFQATPGHFRIVVFTVTPVPFSLSTNEVTAGEAEAWLGTGLDALPRAIGEQPVTVDTKASALIYEFVKPTRDDDVEYLFPGTLPAADHLRRARLWESLGL